MLSAAEEGSAAVVGDSVCTPPDSAVGDAHDAKASANAPSTMGAERYRGQDIPP